MELTPHGGWVPGTVGKWRQLCEEMHGCVPKAHGFRQHAFVPVAAVYTCKKVALPVVRWGVDVFSQRASEVYSYTNLLVL